MEDRKPLSPQDKLANLYDSLADDVFEGHVKVDKETSKRAARIARKAIEQACDSHDKSEPDWAKRTEKEKSADKGPAK